jgi:nucleotide-binding universal stress UspA family protein
MSTEVVRYAALADVLVVGRDPQRTQFAGPTTGLLGDILCRTRTPVLIPGDDPAPFKATGPALVAWDGSYEAANAVRASVGLLKGAGTVRVFQVEEEKAKAAFPGTHMLEFLSRHGIHADLVIDRAPGNRDADYVSASIMSQAGGMGAGYIVLGGYSHSRLGEYFFGGVTRTLLGGCPVPVVMSH